MNIHNKLNQLSEKIDYYSDFLDTKTNEINNLSLTNENEKLKEWNKNKKVLLKEINSINNSFNNFVKDANKFINQVKQSNETNDTGNTRNLLKFGSENEYENVTQSENEPNYFPPDVLGLMEDNDTYFKVYNKLIDYYVVKEKDLFKKVYNCLVFGTFLRNYLNMSNLYFEQYNVDNYENMINKSRALTNNFLNILEENNAYLSGGYINMAVNYVDYRNIVHTDLDIYVNKENSEKFIKEIKELFEFVAINFQLSSAYNQSFFKKNGLLSRVKCIGNTKMDILIIRDDFEIKNVIKNFDLSYCSVYLDLKNNEVKGNVKDMINKSGKLNKDYAEKYLFNKFIQRRIKKYKDRGYETRINTKIDITIKPKDETKVELSNVIQRMYQEMYFIYRNNFPIEEAVQLFSVLNYTEKQLIETCKIIAEKVYFNKDYFYYVILNVSNKILSKNSQDVALNSQNKNPNFYKYAKLVTDFQDKLLRDAELLGLSKFTKAPQDVQIILNYILKEDFIKFLENTFDTNINITNDNKNKIAESLKNNDINLQELLVQSDIKLISEKQFVTIIIILLYTYYKNKNLPLTLTDWFIGSKFITATWINKKGLNYNNKITVNNSVDLREVMYYDLFEAEEKSYDELMEDDDNILFYLDDTKTGFTYSFETLTTNNLQEFILQCNKELLGAPSVNDTEDYTKWYSKLSSPYNIGVLTTQFYQALSLYDNSPKNNKIRKFIIKKPKQFEFITNINALMWTSSHSNIWDEGINLVSETHCNIGMKVYDEIEYQEN
jgi:hypothetical protein